MRVSLCFFLGWALLVLAGCGGSAPGGGATGGGTPGGPATKYPVGAVYEKSGALENWGKASEEGMRLAAEELKGKDGIEFDLFIEDNKSSPDQSASAFVSLVNVKNVLCVIGAVASSNTRAMKEQANKSKVPIITHASTNTQLVKDTDWVYRACWNDDFQGKVCAQFALNNLKSKKAVIVTDAAQDYSRGLSRSFDATFKAAGGTVIEELTYSSGDKVFTSQAGKLKAADPDVVFVSGYAAEAALILKAAREQGFTKPFLGGDGWDDQAFFDIAGALAGTGVYICNHAHNDDPAPRVQAFVKAYEKRFGYAPQNTMCYLSYDAVYMLHDAILRAKAKGPVTRESVRDAIGATKDLKLVTGTVSIGPDREMVKRAVVVEMTADKKFKFVAEVKP